MYPDSPEANKHSCKCPVHGGGNNRGEGTVIEGVKSYTVNPDCKIHGNPRWWMRAPEMPASPAG